MSDKKPKDKVLSVLMSEDMREQLNDAVKHYQRRTGQTISAGGIMREGAKSWIQREMKKPITAE